MYATRHNPAKFVITPDTLKEAGIPESRADEMFDILVDYMAGQGYLTWGRKELPEGIAAHFKEERKIVARNITEFGWRYFKKAKAMLLKVIKSGDNTSINTIVKNANQKALTAANAEIIGKSLLELIGYILVSIGGGLGYAVLMNPLFGTSSAVSAGRLFTGISAISGGIQVAKDYSESKKSLNKIASRA